MHTCRLGCISVFTGTGRGKTTSALGYAMRKLAEKKRVIFFYFHRDEFHEKYLYEKLRSLGFEHEVSRMNLPRSRDEEIHRELFHEGRRMMERIDECARSGKYDAIILDDINRALSLGIVSLKDFVQWLSRKPLSVSVVLTGEDCPQEVIQMADYVTLLQNDPLKE